MSIFGNRQTLSYQEYREEVRRIAEDAIEEANEYGQDVHDVVHETVDGHQWIIYYAYNDSVLAHSENADAWEDCYAAEDIGQLVVDRGMDGARTVQAYFALHDDVTNEVHAQLQGRPFTQKKIGLENW